jgi:hypothetical protein
LKFNSDFIIIKTAEEFQAINDGLDKRYILASSIDIGEIEFFAAIGTIYTPFTGILEGLNYEIGSAIVYATDWRGGGVSRQTHK